jgi:hypothetical protein
MFNRNVEFSAFRSSPLHKLYRAIEQRLGVSQGSIRLRLDGRSVFGSQTYAELEMEDGDSFYAYQEQLGGKPVIYLLPPKPLLATVELALLPTWAFSALYPLSPTSSKSFAGYSTPGEIVEWTVDVKPNGDMMDERTGVEVSYLFWEAQ